MAADSGRPKNIDPTVAKANLLGALENIGGFLKENVAPSFLGGGLRAKDRVPFNESLNTLLGGELPSRGQLGAEGFAELIGAMVPVVGRPLGKTLKNTIKRIHAGRYEDAASGLGIRRSSEGGDWQTFRIADEDDMSGGWMQSYRTLKDAREGLAAVAAEEVAK